MNTYLDDWARAYLGDTQVPHANKPIIVFMMFKYANRNGAGARPSHATLAKDMGVSESAVMRAISEARDSGYLHHESQAGGSNLYQATTPA